MFRTLLEKAGYEVKCAEDATEALNILANFRPDLILMDIELPDGNGLKLTQWIKGNGRTKSIPVVALTSHTSLEERVAASEIGCEGFISKPIDTRGFVRRVEAYLAARK